MRRTVPALLLAALLAAPTAAQEPGEAAFVHALLAKVQPAAIAAGVEVCGFVGRRAGAWATTRPAWGTRDACVSDRPAWMEVTASWHAHGRHDPRYLGELPSGADLRSDRALGIDGWIATPAGRLWHVDGRAMVARQACGPGCLPADARAPAAGPDDVAKAYTYAGLLARLGR